MSLKWSTQCTNRIFSESYLLDGLSQVAWQWLEHVGMCHGQLVPFRAISSFKFRKRSDLQRILPTSRLSEPPSTYPQTDSFLHQSIIPSSSKRNPKSWGFRLTTMWRLDLSIFLKDFILIIVLTSGLSECKISKGYYLSLNKLKIWEKLGV